MIFCSKNEKDVPAWQLILEGKKTVTRRLKPVKEGSILAVQPNRGKKQVCKIRVLRCEPHPVAYQRLIDESIQKGKKLSKRSLGDFLASIFGFTLDLLDEEAKKEGFSDYMYLWLWLHNHGIDIEKTYRIEFERVIEQKSPCFASR